MSFLIVNSLKVCDLPPYLGRINLSNNVPKKIKKSYAWSFDFIRRVSKLNKFRGIVAHMIFKNFWHITKKVETPYYFLTWFIDLVLGIFSHKAQKLQKYI